VKPTNSNVKIVYETNVVTEDNRRVVAACGGYASNVPGELAHETNIANAQVVAAAWNACRTINPDNPLAAANALADAVAALEATEEADKAWAACQKCSKLPPEGLCYACYKKFEAAGAMRKSALARLKGGEQ